MGQNWQEIKLGDICEKIGSGATPRGGSDVYIGEGISLIRSQNVHNMGFKKNGLAHIGDTHARQLAGVTVEHHDVLLNITGDSVARTCQVDSSILPARVNQHVAIIRPKEDVLSSRYLRYVLVQPSMQQHLLSLASSGATRNALTKQMIEALTLLLPPLPEQKAIAAVLSSLDDKIELLRRQNENLEKIAQTIFKEWFVEFNFPDKNGKLYKASGGKMVDSELGPIPAGWKVGILGDEFKVAIGRTPPRKEHEWFSTVPTDVRWMSVKDLGECQVFIDKTTEFLTRDAIARFNIPVIPPDTVVLSFKLTVGRVAITTSEMLSNEAIAQFQLRNGGLITPEYLYLFLKSFDYSSLGSTSSIATAVNSESIRGIPAVIPDQPTTARANDLLVPTFSKLRANVGQIGTLVQLRDTLLPKLMSGHIRIGEYT